MDGRSPCRENNDSLPKQMPRCDTHFGQFKEEKLMQLCFFFLESNRNFVCHKYNLIKLLYQIKTTESTREDRKKQGDHIHNSSTHDASPSGVRRPLKKVEMRPMGKNLTPLACTL